MEENGQVSQTRSIILFGFVAIILAALLIAGLVFGKRYVTSQQSPAKVVKTAPEATKNTKQPDTNKEEATQQPAVQQGQQSAQTQAPKEQQQPQTNNSPSTSEPQSSGTSQSASPPATGPSHITETGPSDTVAILLAVIALAYTMHRYVMSWRYLRLVK